MPRPVVMIDHMGTRGALAAAVARAYLKEKGVHPAYVNYAGLPSKVLAVPPPVREIRAEVKERIRRYYPNAGEFLPPFYPRQVLNPAELQSADFVLVPEVALQALVERDYGVSGARLSLPTLRMRRGIRFRETRDEKYRIPEDEMEQQDDAFFSLNMARIGCVSVQPGEEDSPPGQETELSRKLSPKSKAPPGTIYRNIAGVQYTPRTHPAEEAEAPDIMAVGLAVGKLVNGEI